MQEIFDRTPIEEFEDEIVRLRKDGNTRDADALAYLVAVVRWRSGNLVHRA